MALAYYLNDPFFGDFWPSPFQLFDRAFQTESSNSSELWFPTCDLKETENSFVLNAELPGIKKEDISIELNDNILTLSGERTHENKEENENYTRTERRYGKFTRSVRVPKGTTEEQIQAKFDNGVLEITFPKEARKEEQKKIEIN